MSSTPKLSIALAYLLLGAPASISEEPPHAARSRTLIEFGWDEPDPAYLKAHIAEMDRSLFDGCVFHPTYEDASGPVNFVWQCWGTRAFEERGLGASRRILASLKPKRLTKNLIRLNMTPGKVDWFDDHGAILNNARLVAALARSGPCLGILLDTEQYEGKLFDYRSQRLAKTKTWVEYAGQARVRGRELMKAFQEGFPNLTVLLTFGHSHVWLASDLGKKPLAETEYGLLAPFLDGMIDAARGNSRIVDGFERSYGYKESARFERARRIMTEDVLAIVAEPERYKKTVSPGFGLWLDYDWRRKGWNVEQPDRNHFSPEAFEFGLKSALRHSDEIVWIYTEKPRWWTPEGKASDLPPAYEHAIRKAVESPHD